MKADNLKENAGGIVHKRQLIEADKIMRNKKILNVHSVCSF